MIIDFKSRNIARYEKEHGSIYNAIGYSTVLAIEFLKVGTGHFEEDDMLFEYFDEVRAKHGGIVPLVDYLIDKCEEGGFFTYLTGCEVKEVAKAQQEKSKKLSLMTEEEKAKEAVNLVRQKMVELRESAGIKDGKK